MKKIFYTEPIFPVSDYFKTIQLDEVIFDVFIPLLASALTYIYVFPSLYYSVITGLLGNVINFLAILIGFSITCITILVGSDSISLQQLKVKPSKRVIAGKNITLYQLLLINFLYSVILEIVTLLYVLVIHFVLNSDSKITVNDLDMFKQVMIAIIVFLVLHVLFLNLRNITNFYFTFWNNTTAVKKEEVH